MTELIQDEQGIHMPQVVWPDVNALPEWAMLSQHIKQVVKSKDQYSTYRLNFGKVPIGELL